MPYELRSQGDKFCVAKKGGEVLKCYDDRGEAVKYLRALWANVQEGFAEFSMTITKTSLKDGEMRWRAVASDTEKDYYGERMSPELFKDFVQRIEAGNEVPEPFKSSICEDGWCGGMPYVSIAHYKSGVDQKNVPGVPKSIYVDGDCLKATGIMLDTPLGNAVFKSLQKDLVEKRDDKVRISIGFLDLEHSHGDVFTFVRKSLKDKCPLCKKGVGDKIYKKGCLVHLALTRVPANPRTDVEVEKSMTTKREDAESIIEDEEVIKGLDLKSQAEDDILVVKSDDEDEDEMMTDGKKKKKGDMAKEECSTVETPAEAKPENTVLPLSPVEKSLAALAERVNAIKSQGLTGADALQAVQSDFENLGNVIKAEFTPPPSPEEVAAKNLETTLRSLLSEMLPQALAQTVAPMQSKLEAMESKLESELRAKSLNTPIRKEQVETVQRSLPVSVVQKQAAERVAQQTLSQFDMIARQSVGIQ